MKRTLFVTLAALVTLSVSAFTLLGIQTISSLERLGIPADVTKQCVWSSFSGGYLSYPNPTKLKQIATGERAAVVREVFEFAKRYTQSEDFKKQYLEYREGKKPTPPEAPKSMDEQRKTQKADLQKSLKEAEQNMKKAPADQKEIYKGVVDMLKEQLTQIGDPNNPMYSKDMEAMMKQSYDAEMVEYKNKVVEWESEYPTNPTLMIKTWLTEFLEISKDVDFNAALKQGKFDKKEFVNPDYEGKSANWKMCYRAGKETVQAGRAAAQQWLKELK